MNAFFFDVDGTLFDTRRDLAATVNHTRADLGLARLPVEEVIIHVGQGARYLLNHSILGEMGSSAPAFDEVWELFRSHYAEHCCETLTPYPLVLETLHELKRRGVLLGINTNKPNFAVRTILEKFELTELFGAAVIAGGDGIALKPDAASLIACAERLGHPLAPDDWMVGDSWTDLECAARAGVQSAFCSYGFGKRNQAPATRELAAFADLLDL